MNGWDDDEKDFGAAVLYVLLVGIAIAVGALVALVVKP